MAGSRIKACSRPRSCARAMLVAAALLSSTPPAPAQSGNVSDIAAYRGADREQRLIEGAKREAMLTLYSNAPTEDNAALLGAFAKKHGIKVNLWRASSEEIRQRALAEAKAQRYEVDFILNNGPALEALRREKLLREVSSPHLADLMTGTAPTHRGWAGFCVNVLVQAYNTSLVKKEELPKTYQALADPKWKGRLGIEVDDFDWFAGLIEELGEVDGIRLFRDIAAINGFSVRKGHTLLANLVAAGEIPLGLQLYGRAAQAEGRAGRLVCAGAAGRDAERHRGRECGAASARGGAVSGLHALGCAGDSGRARLRGRQHPGGRAARSRLAQDGRFGQASRRRRQMAAPLFQRHNIA
jgi:spermidine/putrescine-binding protein